MMPSDYIIGHYHPFPEAIPHLEAGYSRVTHPSATKNLNKSKFSVRLACVRRAASVHPEPGSNSLKSCIYQEPRFLIILFHYESLAITDFSVFSDFFLYIPDFKSRNFKGRNFFVLFSFQSAVSHWISLRQLIYYITDFWICQ